MPTTPMPHDGAPRQVVFFNKDFVAFLVSIGLAFLFFVGFAYRAAFFKSLGVPLEHQEFDFLGLLVRGLYLLQDGWVFGCVIAVFAALLAIYIWSNQRRPLVHYGAMAVMFVSATFGAGWIGDAIGREHARELTVEDLGAKAVCTLRNDDGINATGRKIFERFSTAGRLRIVSQNKDFIYFAVASPEAEGVIGGQSLVIPKKDISFCRLVGVGSW